MITSAAVTAAGPILSTATSTAISLSAAGATQGDVIVLVAWADDAGSGRVITGPTGWTQLRPFDNLKSGTTTATAALGAWALVWDGTATTATLTHPVSATSQSASLIRLRHDVTDPVLQAGPWAGRADAGSGATTTTAVAPSIALPRAGTLVTLAGERTIAAETQAQISATPGTVVTLAGVSGTFGLVVAARDATAGATGPTTITWPNAHTNNAAAGHMAILPGARQPTEIRIGSHTAQLMVGRSGTMAHVTDVRQTRPGMSVAAVSSGTVWCAHRGGSRDYPEMSRQAYAQAALLGWPVLEISLTRSSDGVWVGLHDRYLDRVVLGVDGTTLDPQQMTWAQIDARRIRGATAPNRPSQADGNFARLDDLLTRYPRHVWLVDPKYVSGASDIAALLTLLDAHGGPARIILKSFGVGSSPVVDAGAARGYRAWGYYYPANLPALSQQDVDRFAWLGMSWDASQADWDTLRARAGGRPIWAHICPDRAAVAAARAKGAQGYQCSGVIDLAGVIRRA